MTAFHYETLEDKVTIENLLRDEWQGGKKVVHSMRMAKSVTNVDGEPIDWRLPLSVGTKLTFVFPEARSTYKPVELATLKVLYEDEHILAVSKPAGIDTHPSDKDNGETLMNFVMAYVMKNGGDYAEHIHRLDKGTAGILLIAKHPIAKTLFDRMLEQNEIVRTYEAEVDGLLKKPKGTIKLPIGRDRHQNGRRRVSLSGQSAITHFRVIERKDDTTIVEAKLETGRTHQIRVHLAHLGHPVVGDVLYDGSKSKNGKYRLTATSLIFTHPFTGQQLTIGK